MPLALVITLVLAIIAAAGLETMEVQAETRQRELDRRINLAAGGTSGFASANAARSRAISRIRRSLDRLTELFAVGMTHRWGLRASGLTVLAVALSGFVTPLALAGLMMRTHNGFVIPLSALCALVLPRLLLKHQQASSERAFLHLFPDALDMLVRMLRAGLPITTTIRLIGREAPPPVNAAFSGIANRLDIGVPFGEALALAGEQIDLADFRFFSVTVSLQQATGGNLAETLELLADIIRKRREMRLKARATSAEVRVSAYILCSLPFVVAGALAVVNPQYVKHLINDPRGHILLGRGGADDAGGYFFDAAVAAQRDARVSGSSRWLA